MKLSEITAQLVKRYAHIDGNEDDELIEQVILPAARAYVLSYTGQTAETADEIPDLAVACLALSCHLYDHRDMSEDKAQINAVMDGILGMHALNYL